MGVISHTVKIIKITAMRSDVERCGMRMCFCVLLDENQMKTPKLIIISYTEMNLSFAQDSLILSQ